MKPSDADDLEIRMRRARRRLLRMHHEAGVGHIGGNLSCLDAVITILRRMDRERDRFVLCKGHSAGALYVGLWDLGLLGDDDLKGFHQDGSPLAGHPVPRSREEIHFATGSLGHGLGLAAGVALGWKLRGHDGHVYALMSDGEWQEGSNWEAFQFIRHAGLDNLTVLIDRNGLQGFGKVDEVCQRDLHKELSHEQTDCREISGHDPLRLETELRRHEGRPRFFVLNTVKGYPVRSLMNRIESHYLPLSDEDLRTALEDVGEP